MKRIRKGKEEKGRTERRRRREKIRRKKRSREERVKRVRKKKKEKKDGERTQRETARAGVRLRMTKTGCQDPERLPDEKRQSFKQELLSATI